MQVNNVYYFDKNTNKRKSFKDHISRDLRFVPRSDNPAKSLSDKARNLATNYFKMISKNANGIIFVNSDFITSITERGVRQNNNIHKQLSDIFHIKYHQIIRINGKRYRDGFTIQHTKNTEEILADPQTFYASKNEENPRENFLTHGKKFPELQQEIAALYIDKTINKNINNRSTEVPEKTSPEFEAIRANSLGKNLKDFYPLSREDGNELKTMSGREFSLNAMNEILLDMSKRLADRSFDTKNGFMKYFAVCLRNEKRDTVQTGHETFRIKSNLTEEEKEADKIFKYLEKLEYSLEVTPEWHFKKKLACVLEDKIAYDLLTAYQSLVIKDQVAKIYLRRVVELTPLQQEIVLNQVKASHPCENVQTLEFPPINRQYEQNKMKNQNYTTTNDDHEPQMWKDFKSAVQARFEHRGESEHLFKAWFDKLERTQNISANKLVLKGGNFMIDYIRTNYQSILEAVSKEKKMNIELVFASNEYPPYLYTPTGRKF